MLLVHGSKLHFSILFILQSYHMINKLQQTEFNKSSEIDFNNFMKIHRKSKIEPYSFLLISH